MRAADFERALAGDHGDRRKLREDGAALVGVDLRFGGLNHFGFLAVDPIDSWVLRDTLDFPLHLALDLFLLGNDLGLTFDFGLARAGLGFGALHVDQGGRNLLPLAALDAIEADPVTLHLVLADDVEAAIL